MTNDLETRVYPVSMIHSTVYFHGEWGQDTFINDTSMKVYFWGG